MGTCESSTCCSNKQSGLQALTGVEKVSASRGGQAVGRPDGEAEKVTLRIFHINDVYTLEHFPALKAHIDALGTGMGHQHVVTTLAGDFVAPSLLSALDYGAGMVDCMNAVPVDYVCFGNHESDIPPEALQQRIKEFKGVWLNSNMPDWLLEEGPQDARPLCFGSAASAARMDRMASVNSAARLRAVRQPSGPSSHPSSPRAPTSLSMQSVQFSDDLPWRRSMPTSCLVKGLEVSGRKVALLGLLTARRSLYRMGAFGGAVETLQPVVSRAAELCAELEASHPDLDCIVPLTHQDLPEDEQLASLGKFPLILGGHDHEPSNTTVGPCTIVKAGMDAENVFVVDLTWDKGAPPGTLPEVETQMIRLAPVVNKKGDKETHLPEQSVVKDQAMLERVELAMQPVAELEASTLARFDPMDPPLSSVGARKGPCSMASLIAAALRDANSAEGGVINAGSIRGSHTYHDGVVTFAHLTTEVPFPSANITIKVPGQTLSDAVRLSRLPWTEKGIEAASALHTDPDMKVDVETGEVFQVGGENLEPERLYRIVVDAYIVRKNPILKEYAAQYPENIPPDDAGQPALPCLVAFFCKQAWLKLAEGDESGKVTKEKFDKFFENADANGDRFIDFEELLAIIESKLGKDMATRVLARQMMNVVQKNQDGCCTYAELAACISANITEACTRQASVSSMSEESETLVQKLSTVHMLRKGSEMSSGTRAPSISAKAKADRLRALLEDDERDAPEAAEFSPNAHHVQFGSMGSRLSGIGVSVRRSLGLASMSSRGSDSPEPK